MWLVWSFRGLGIDHHGRSMAAARRTRFLEQYLRVFVLIRRQREPWPDIDFWNFKVPLQWHASFNKAIPLSTSWIRNELSNYIHIYINVHIFTHIHTHTHMADHLVSDNQLEYFSLQKTISPILSISYLPVLLCLGLRTQDLSPTHVSSSIGVIHVQVINRQSWRWEFMIVARRHNLIANSLFFCLSQS